MRKKLPNRFPIDIIANFTALDAFSFKRKGGPCLTNVCFYSISLKESSSLFWVLRFHGFAHPHFAAHVAVDAAAAHPIWVNAQLVPKLNVLFWDITPHTTIIILPESVGNVYQAPFEKKLSLFFHVRIFMVLLFFSFYSLGTYVNHFIVYLTREWYLNNHCNCQLNLDRGRMISSAVWSLWLLSSVMI